MSPAMPGRPPFRADHIGSLLRPPELKQAFRERSAGKLGATEFARVQDEAIRQAVRMQEEAGFKVVTDGEFRRNSYWGRFAARIEGCAVRPAQFKFRDDEGHAVEFTAPYAEARLRRVQPLAADEFSFLRTVTATTAKVTLPAPSTLHFYRCDDYADRKAYGSLDEFFADVVEIFQQELAELAALGCRYVQLDEVALAMLCDPAICELTRAKGHEPKPLVHRYIDAINQAVANVPPAMSVGVHMCRGNFKGNYLSAGGYDEIAEALFNQTRVSHFLLEYDTPRAGDFAPLRFLPRDKGVVLGLVSSKTPAVETVEELVRRVEEAARIARLGQLGISPQCGFASTVAGNPVDLKTQAAKLNVVTRAAEQIWGPN
jgi:5-methyltetrahydropteroyltriglutamate--homocysteine methyltransferase